MPAGPEAGPDAAAAPSDAPPPVAVAGSGAEAVALAWAAALRGGRAALIGPDAAEVARAAEMLDGAARAMIRSGRLSPEAAEAARARIDLTADPAAAAGCAIGVAAPEEAGAGPNTGPNSGGMQADAGEDLSAVLSALEAALPAHAPLAILGADDPRPAAAALADPSRVLGLVILAPAHLAPLAEIAAPDPDGAPARALAAFAHALGMETVTLRPSPLLIGARLLARLDEAAEALLLHGANPWELDEAAEAAGFETGPLKRQDLRGVEAALAARRRWRAAFPAAAAEASGAPPGEMPPEEMPPEEMPIVPRMVEEGRLGRPVGVGWYRYPGGQQVIDPLIEDLVREEAHFAGIARQEPSEAEIVAALSAALAAECRAMAAACVGRPAQIALVLRRVAGAPAPRD